MTHEKDWTPPAEFEDLLDGTRQIFSNIILDSPAPACSEVARPPMTTQIEVEHVEPGPGEVVREAPRWQVPGITVLPESVHQKDRCPRPSALRFQALTHDREGHTTGRTCDHQLLNELSALPPIHDLLNDSTVKDQVGLV
jgi:hypothetical protein